MFFYLNRAITINSKGMKEITYTITYEVFSFENPPHITRLYSLMVYLTDTDFLSLVTRLPEVMENHGQTQCLQ